MIEGFFSCRADRSRLHEAADKLEPGSNNIDLTFPLNSASSENVMNDQSKLRQDIAFIDGLLELDGYHPYWKEVLAEALGRRPILFRRCR
jgi:hypothetical protein